VTVMPEQAVLRLHPGATASISQLDL